MSIFPSVRFRPEFSPIMGFVGANRSGKSALAVDYAIRLAERKGAPLWSNIAITADGLETHRISGMHDFSHIAASVVLLDDILAVAPARSSQDAPVDLTMRLASLGHRDCVVVWTTPAYSDVDISLRKVTQSVVAVRPIYRREIKGTLAEGGQMWPQTLLSYAKTFSTIGEESVTIDKTTPRTSHGLVRLSKLRLDAYNTREEIVMLADHSVCPVCHLRKRREYCNGKHPLPSPSEAPDVEGRAARSVVGPAPAALRRSKT